MRSTLTLTTTFEGDQPGEGEITTVLALDGDQLTGQALTAMHADAVATIANYMVRLCGVRTTDETLEEDGRRVY